MTANPFARFPEHCPAGSLLWVHAGGRDGPDNVGDKLGAMPVIPVTLLPAKFGIVSWVPGFSFSEDVAVGIVEGVIVASVVVRDTEDVIVAGVEDDTIVVGAEDVTVTGVEEDGVAAGA